MRRGRPYRDGNDELCGFANPSAGPWHILLHAYTSFSGATLVVNYTTGAGGGSALQNGVPLTGLGAAAGTELRYTLEVPAGATDLTVQLAGGTGDADLYVRFGSAPSLSTYDCRPYEDGNDEHCALPVQAGPWHVLVHAYTAFSGASLVARYTVPGGGGARTITWTAFNKPYTLTQGGATTTISYDADFNRLQKTTATRTTVYVGQLYERVTSGSLVEHKHYLYGSGHLVAIYTSRNNNTHDIQYLHTDHLGSVNVITNDNGQVIARLAYDPHGKRRHPNGQDATNITSSVTREAGQRGQARNIFQ